MGLIWELGLNVCVFSCSPNNGLLISIREPIPNYALVSVLVYFMQILLGGNLPCLSSNADAYVVNDDYNQDGEE